MARLFQVAGGVRLGAALILSLALCCLWPATTSAATPEKKKEKPAQISISGYGLLGNRELKRILRTIELGGKKPQFFESTFVEDAALILMARIKRDGYLDPEILISLRLENRQPIEVNAADLIENPLPQPLRIKRALFRVRKGVLYHYDTLRFEGLESISEKEARTYFQESDTLILLKTARVYTPDRLRHGLSSLKEVLDRQGYKDAVAEADLIWSDRRTGAVGVHIKVKQGKKYLVRSVREDFYKEGSVAPEQSSTVYPNKPYSKLWVQDFILGLKTNQFKLGYPDATVEIKPVGEQPQDDQVLVDLSAAVKSGPQVRIGDVKFEGQKRTRTSLLSRRVRIERGELLNPIDVEEGRSRLARLGIFESVELDYQAQDEHTRDVIYRLNEGKRLNLSLLFGYGSYELLRAGFEADANNLWGEAHHAELKAVQSFKASSGSLTYTIPELIGRDVDLFLNGSGLRREEVSFTRLEYGGGVGLHKYFREAATDLSGRYSYQILSAQEFGNFEAVASEGLTNPAVGSIIFEIKHDRRDNPLYPRKGYKVFATVETATQYLGGDANYERVEITPSWHLRLGGGRFLGLGLTHGVAISFGSPADNLPFVRRFFPGGENSIRGFPEGEASPRNEVGQFVGAETFTLGSVELEQALTPRWSLVFFSDSLGFARHIENYPFDTGLYSVGGGVRWRTLIGPVRLEYGYNLNPRPRDPTGTLQFSLGYPF